MATKRDEEIASRIETLAPIEDMMHHPGWKLLNDAIGQRLSYLRSRLEVCAASELSDIQTRIRIFSDLLSTPHAFVMELDDLRAEQEQIVSGDATSKSVYLTYHRLRRGERGD